MWLRRPAADWSLDIFQTSDHAFRAQMSSLRRKLYEMMRIPKSRSDSVTVARGFSPWYSCAYRVRRGATPEPVGPWFVDVTIAARSSVAPRRQMKNNPKPWAEAHGYHP